MIRIFSLRLWATSVHQTNSVKASKRLTAFSRLAVRLLSMSFVTIVLLGLAAAAQPAPKMAKLGYLSPFSSASDQLSKSLVRELRTLGYIEGKNIAIEYRRANDKLDRLPALAHELVGLKVDALVAVSTPATLAVRNATKTIPIVFLNVSDPIAAGLIDSLARPGGNVTGITNLVGELMGKRLELIKETVPNLSRLALLWNPQDRPSAQQWKESQLPARQLGLELHSMQVSSADQYPGAFKAALSARSSALAVTGHALAFSNRRLITDLAAENRLPAIYNRKDFVESGGMMSYGDDQIELYRRAAVFVDKVLKGTQPADLPVEQPTKFEFAINLKTAKQIGLNIPQSVLFRADKVIK